MSVQEWWWEADNKISFAKKVTKKSGGFSQAEWEAARRKHRERMKAKEHD